VQVSKQVLVGAGVVFLALFGAVFFLLGRESRRPRAVTAVAEAPAYAPSAAPLPSAPLPSAPPPSAPPLPTTAPAIVSEPTTRYGIVESSPRGGIVESDPRALPPSVSVTVGDDGGAVRDYFTRMQAIQMYGPTGDTGELANKILASSMNGDNSGFDDLVKAAQDGAEKARAITPPAGCAGCAAYHARLLAMLGDGVAMVKQVKTALASGDTGQLTALAASGSALQSRASALEAEARQIKSRYGLR
jgi:hypothetical protein